MDTNDFGKRNSVTTMLSDREKEKLEIMVKEDQQKLSEWLRNQIILTYFVRHEQVLNEIINDK